MTHAYRPHDPEELGAYVFGLLTPEQAHVVEEHLAVCPECHREWEELRQMTDLLDEVPPEVFLEGPPDGDLVLQRTLRQIRSEVSATVRGIPAGERCQLVVVGRDGSREVAGSWLVPQSGWRQGMTLDGSAIVAPDQVAAVVVENEAGHQFAELQA